MNNEKVTAWLRTVVPGLWAAVVAWLVTLGLPAELAQALAGGEEFVVSVVLAGVYALLRWVEPKLPDWATRILLGSAKPPVYTVSNHAE